MDPFKVKKQQISTINYHVHWIWTLGVDGDNYSVALKQFLFLIAEEVMLFPHKSLFFAERI